METGYERACENCGTTFEAVDKGKWTKRFCSVVCKNAWWRAWWEENPHNCPRCGQVHIPDALARRAADTAVAELLRPGSDD